MSKRMSIVSVVFAFLMAIATIGVAIASLVYGFSDVFNTIIDVEEWRSALISDATKEIVFGVTVLIFSIVAFVMIGKVEKLRALKGWHIVLFIAGAISVIYQIFNNFVFLMEDLTLYPEPFAVIINIWIYGGIVIAILGVLTLIFNIISLVKVNNAIKNKQQQEFAQVSGQSVAYVNPEPTEFSMGAENFNAVNNNFATTSNFDASSNNELAVLLGLSDKQPIQMNNQLQNIDGQNVENQNSVVSQNNAEERKEKLKAQIGAEKLRYAQGKAKEYKAKLENGELTQREFDVLMTALKKELLNK